MLLFVLMLGVLVWGPPAVLSRFRFSFSNVEQCGPVDITFIGGGPNQDALPVTLTLVPFDSHPVLIPIPNTTMNATGVRISFLPLPADTSFVASLDDAEGNAIGRVSDIMRVLPSPIANSTCIPAVTDSTNRFDVKETPSQCQNLSVMYDRRTMARAPLVRLFVPTGLSFPLNLTEDDVAQGRATYLLSAERGNEAVFLFDDGLDHRETSQLFTIAGDTSSDRSCLIKHKHDNNQTDTMMTTMPNTNSDIRISRPVVIAIAAGGGGLILCVLFLAAIYIFRNRRRSKRMRGTSRIDYAPRRWTPTKLPSSSPSTASFTDALVHDPPYVSEKYASSSFSSRIRDTLSSWIQVVPEDQRYSHPPRNNIAEKQADDQSIGRSHLASLDIEGILSGLAELNTKTASVQTVPPASTEQSTKRNSAPSSQDATTVVTKDTRDTDPFLSPPSPAVSPTQGRRLYPARGHLRDPSDVPGDPSYSMTLSALFPSPPVDEHTTRYTSDFGNTELRLSTTIHSSTNEEHKALSPPPSYLDMSGTSHVDDDDERMSMAMGVVEVGSEQSPSPRPLPRAAVLRGLPANPRGGMPLRRDVKPTSASHDQSSMSSPVIRLRDTGDSWGTWYGVAR